MARKNADDRRLEVLEETLNQIRVLGMSSVRVSDVASAMGVSPALIMYHFDTKERLLSEALIRAAERDLSTLGRIVRSARSPLQRLSEALEWYGPTGQARGWQVWIDAWSLALRDKNIAKVVGELQERWVEEIAGVISDGVADGVFASEDPGTSATRLTALLDGLAVRSLVQRTSLSRDQLRKWLQDEITRELAVETPLSDRTGTRDTTAPATVRE
ncbi:TetR/AcrR family transcriptional regulator [Streptomyces sp. NPDC026672]|uniref:TetR/AcrR family transcriptional regulator n=1 Tax=unclassified Streptomyces TaxID=2593676 RepID=UPI0033EDBAC8